MIIKKTQLPYLYLFFALLISIGVYCLSNQISREALIEIIEKFGTLGIGLFILLNLITYSLAPLSNSPLLVAGFFLYGPEVVLYIFIAMVISYIVNFWISRKFGHRILKKILDDKTYNQVDALVKNPNLIKYFLLIRVLQGAGQDVISYASGLSNMQFGKYLIISIIGSLPATIIWLILAGSTTNSLIFLTISRTLGIGFFLVLSLLFISKKVGKK